MNIDEIYKKIEDFFKQQELFDSNVYIDKIDKKEIAKTIVLYEIDSHSKNRIKELDSKAEIIKQVIDNSQLIYEKGLWEKSETLQELYENIHNCQECPLGTLRKNFVFGSGNPKAHILIIGEAPGAEEDEQGEPFVGRAGQLLTKILMAINLERKDVFIGNIIKCRPPNNRVPLPVEVNKCEPYLKKQIELIKPAFILALGLTAAETLLKRKLKMADIRGQVFEYAGIKMLITYHPAALLRNPNLKRDVWEDIKLLRKMYDEFLESI